MPLLRKSRSILSKNFSGIISRSAISAAYTASSRCWCLAMYKMAFMAYLHFFDIIVLGFSLSKSTFFLDIVIGIDGCVA
jgi:hypothetical protein